MDRAAHTHEFNTTERNAAADTARVESLRAVASGSLGAAGKSFKVDVLSNGQHIFRLANVSEVFGVAPDHRHLSRTIDRIAVNSKDKALRPIVFVERRGGGRATGISSSQFVALLRAFIQRGMDGKLKGVQAKALSGAWAVASVLMEEGVDSMIDAACGVTRTPAETRDRIAESVRRHSPPDVDERDPAGAIDARREHFNAHAHKRTAVFEPNSRNPSNKLVQTRWTSDRLWIAAFCDRRRHDHLAALPHLVCLAAHPARQCLDEATNRNVCLLSA